MLKNGAQKSGSSKQARSILITQPKPESEKSPYFELARKHNVELTFHPFIKLEPIPAREFRRQKIDIAHFFRICDEMKLNISQDTKYFCITEAVALYLQKFILYRKRKVFYGADGTNKSLFDVINKHKDNEKFLYPCSESFDNDITSWLKSNSCEYATPVLYRIISNDITEVMARDYDVICFFTPGGVKSLLENFPKFKQNGTRIGAFGANTFKAAEDAGLVLDIKAPQPQAPSMISALEIYLSSFKKK